MFYLVHECCTGRSDRALRPRIHIPPETGEAVGDLVEVGQTGTVTTWSWVAAPRPGHPLARPFAWALVRLDGADTAMLHAVDAVSEERMRTGMRVSTRWREQRSGEMADLACFQPEGGR